MAPTPTPPTMPPHEELIGQLRATLGKIQTALNAITEAIAWTDSDGRVQWCNATFSQLVEVPSIAVIGQPLITLLPLSERGQPLPATAHPVHQAMTKPSIVRGEYEFHTTDQRIIFMLEVAAVSVQLDEHQRSMVVVLRNITERKRSENLLKKRNEELATQNKIMMAREERVLELKREINELCRELGKPAKYAG